MSVFPTFSFPSLHSLTAPEEPTRSVHFKTHFFHTSRKERGELACLIIYSNLPTWGRRRNWRLLKLVGLHCCKWRHYLAQDHANSSLWTAFGRKQKKHTQRQIASFTLITKVFFLVKSWKGAIRDFREYAKWKCVFVYSGLQIIY